jgi:hypothetical protein
MKTKLKSCRPQHCAAAIVATLLLAFSTLSTTAITKSPSAPTAAKPVATATAPQLSSIASAAASTAPASAVTEDIRDIRPPYHIPPGWLWLVWVAGGVTLAALGYGLWRWRHRLPGLRPRLPFELALDELESARELMQPEHAREFSIRVSEIVRHYIEVRFATRAAHRTTEEFLHDCMIEHTSPLAAHRESLGDFLHHCDLAKFARWVLSVAEMEAMLQSASAFVRSTGVETAPGNPATGASSTDPSATAATGKTATLAPQTL